MAYAGGTGLVAALADSIQQVAGRHRHTCGIARPSSPQSSVAMLRFEEDHVDYLVLADMFADLAARDARRNQSGGYWIAKDDPHAATQAVIGRLHGRLTGTALLSNGASRVVDP